MSQTFRLPQLKHLLKIATTDVSQLKGSIDAAARFSRVRCLWTLTAHLTLTSGASCTPEISAGVAAAYYGNL